MTTPWVTLGGDTFVTLGGDTWILLDVGGGPVTPPGAAVRAGAVYGIDLCVAWNKIGECVVGTFDGIVRDLAVGEWRLTGPTAALAFAGAYNISDVDTVRIVRDTDVLYSGYVAPVASGTGGLEIVDAADGEHFTLGGADGWLALNSRVCYPTPSTGPPWAAAHDARTGQASAVATGYILANAGSSAIAARQITGLTVVDGSVGLSGTWSARLQPLDEQVRRVCRDGRITCRVAVDFAGAVVVSLAAPADRSATVVFSDQGDLLSIRRVVTPATATYVVSGGQGNLTARTFATAGTATGFARREKFDDESALATLTEVQQSATTKLAQGAETTTIVAVVTDAAAQQLAYLADYDVGDYVAIQVGEERFIAPVSSVAIHIDPSRSVVRPILGTGVLDPFSGLLADVANLQSRFDTQIA